jgi:hypothetical protein
MLGAKNPSSTGHANQHPFWIGGERTMHFRLQQDDIYLSQCEADVTCEGEKRIFLHCPNIHFAPRVEDRNMYLQHVF